MEELNHRSFTAPEGLVGERVDVAVSKLLGFSRTFSSGLVESGGVELDGKLATKSDRVGADSIISVSWMDKKLPEVVPVLISGMSIKWDDPDIVIISKPPFLAAHPSLGWEGDTVLGALAGAGYRIATSGPPERQGIVHRLDVGTSGLMIVAKSEIAYSVLKDQFRDRSVKKEYHALVHGTPVPVSGTVDAPIGRHPGSAWKFAVTRDGRESVTHYDTIAKHGPATLLSIGLETGRTHQIRVHMSANRHSLVGDLLYGADPKLASTIGLERQWLHAVRLTFEHPTTGETVDVTDEYAPDLANSLKLIDEL